MKAHHASFINAVTFIALGLWGYFGNPSDIRSITALIPVFVGIILLILNKGVKKENKIIAHIAVLLTFLMIPGLIKPLIGAMGRCDEMAIFRICVMYASIILAMAYFIKSFRAARRNRN